MTCLLIRGLVEHHSHHKDSSWLPLVSGCHSSVADIVELKPSLPAIEHVVYEEDVSLWDSPPSHVVKEAVGHCIGDCPFDI